MYWEYPDLTTAGAITQCYCNMSTWVLSIQIMKVEITASKVLPTSSQAILQLKNQVSAVPLSPALPALDTLHQQETQDLLLDAGPSPFPGLPK